MEFTAGGTELGVVSLVQENLDLGQHSIILNLGFSDGRAVAGNKDQFGLSLSQGFQSGRVSKDRFSGSLNQSNLVVDIICLFSFSHYKIL